MFCISTCLGLKPFLLYNITRPVKTATCISIPYIHTMTSFCIHRHTIQPCNPRHVCMKCAFLLLESRPWRAGYIASHGEGLAFPSFCAPSFPLGMGAWQPAPSLLIFPPCHGVFIWLLLADFMLTGAPHAMHRQSSFFFFFPQSLECLQNYTVHSTIYIYTKGRVRGLAA